MRTFVLKKKVDWSLLTAGFTFPVETQGIVNSLPGGILAEGTRREAVILMGGTEYRVKLVNTPFDHEKYKHPELMQFRYTEKSDFARALREIFRASRDLLKAQREAMTKRAQASVPTGEEEYLVLWGTERADVFAADCETCADHAALQKEMAGVSEEEFESAGVGERTDEGAGLVRAKTLGWVRRVDRSIGDGLKRLYGWRCQVTGERTGEGYGADVVEAHHIVPFTESLNNDASNLIVLSPNFHRVVHRVHPVFDREKLEFVFANGRREKVQLDRHLRV